MNTSTLIEHLLVNLEQQAMTLSTAEHRTINLRLDLNCLAPHAEHVIGYELREVHEGPHGLELHMAPAQYRCPNCGHIFKVAAQSCDFTCPECGQ